MKKVYLAHNICLNSSYDFNIVKKALDSKDFILVDSIKKADTYIYAGCGVRGVWVDNAIEEINQAILLNPTLEIIATGCFANIEPIKLQQNIKVKNLEIMSFSNIVDKYTNTKFEAIDKSLSQEKDINFEGENTQRKRISDLKKSLVNELQVLDQKYQLNITKKYKEVTKGFVFYNEDEEIEYITITRGCPYKCSYCSIPIGRGGEYTTVPLGDIIEKINNVIKKNIKRILLLGDEIGNYGLGTNNMDFSKLLDFILEKNDLKVAIRYLEPKPFLKHFDTIKKYCENGKIELLYLPIQSGSNKVLKLMNRTYQIDDELIEKILYLRNNTNVIFYTNWMVGFNSETDEDLAKTVQLVKKLDLHINVVIPFSERPNTPALKIPHKVSAIEKKNRHTKLFKIIKEMKRKKFEKDLLLVEEKERNIILDKIINAEEYTVLVD